MKIIRLKDLRTFYDLSQEDIAKILGVKRGTYASWECGSDTIPIKQLYKLANYYEKSIDYLLGLQNKDIPIKGNTSSIDKVLVGSNIKKIRAATGVGQLKFASNININQSTLWAYEKGKTLATTSTLITISKTYKISIDKIVGRK